MTAPASDIRFRESLRADDAEAITALVTDTGFFHRHEIAVARELVDERLARGQVSGYEFIVAEAEQSVVGYACFGEIPCTVGGYDLYWIVVARHWQGRGIGRLLIEQAERRVAAAGGRILYVETSSRPLYAPTSAFYRKCGYQLAATLPDFYAPGDGRLIYQKLLHAEHGAGQERL